MNYYDFVSKIKCTNWWILMYNFFSVTRCMNQALDYFGYFMSLAINNRFDSHTFHTTLYSQFILLKVFYEPLFSLFVTMSIFLHISLINGHDPCIVTTYLISLIYVRESRVSVIHIIESLFWVCFSFFNKYNVVFLLRYKVVLLNIL